MRGVPADGSENDDTVGWCDEKMTESRESGQAVRSLYCCTCCRSWKGRICIFRVFFLLNTRKYILVIQARKTCACIWFFWALNYHDFQGRLKRRGVLVLLCASTMQIDRAWHMCWQNGLHLSLSYLHMYGPAQVQKSLCGILMLPIQFVGAKATSWMSSVDTSVQHMTSQDGFIYKRS